MLRLLGQDETNRALKVNSKKGKNSRVCLTLARLNVTTFAKHHQNHKAISILNKRHPTQNENISSKKRQSWNTIFREEVSGLDHQEL